MGYKLAGYEVSPTEQFQRAVSAYTERSAAGGHNEAPPSPATPVYMDEEGNHFVAMPHEDGVALLPFIPGSAAAGDLGGFLPLEQIPRPEANDKTASLIAGATLGLAPAATARWLTGAAASATSPGGPASGVETAFGALGLHNPMDSGSPSSAAHGRDSSGESLLGPQFRGGPEAMVNDVGKLGLAALLRTAGLSDNPWVGAASNIVGSQLSELANLLTQGGFSRALDDLADSVGLGGLFRQPGRLPGVPDDMDVFTLVPAEDATPRDVKIPTPESIGLASLDKAADALLQQWKADDESSAAEHIANKAIKDNKKALKEAAILSAKDPEALIKRVREFFFGKTSDAKLGAARRGDFDITKPELIYNGVGTILCEGEPISRIGDKLIPSSAEILQGESSVLSAGRPTAYVTCATAPPGKAIEQGASQVLIGRNAANDKGSAAPTSVNPGSRGPADPEAPVLSDAGSVQNAHRAQGNTAGVDGAVATPAEVGEAQPTAASNPQDADNTPADVDGGAVVQEAPDASSAPTRRDIEGETQCIDLEGLSEYDATIAVLRESIAAARETGVSPHDWIQYKLRREQSEAHWRDHPGIVNAHAFWKAYGFRTTLGAVPTELLGMYYGLGKTLGVDNVIQWVTKELEYPPSPARAETKQWFDAASGIATEPHFRFPTPQEVELPSLPPGVYGFPGEMKRDLDLPGEVTYRKPHVNDGDPMGPGAIHH